MLTAIGDLVEDVVVLLSGPPNPGSDVDARISRHRGGSAANVAAAAAEISGRARFVGQVGADELGDRLLDRLRAGGVDTAVRRGGRTGTIVALVAPDGERTMLSDRGAATALDAVDPAWLDDTTVLHVPVYSVVVEPLAGSAARLAALARQRRIPVSVDASSEAVLRAFGVEHARTRIDELRPDVILANEAEAALLGLDVEPAGDAVTVVKRGGRPSRVHTPGGRQDVKVPAARVVDTTGAGDAFAAGFLTSWVEQADDLEAAVHAGHEAARRVLDHPGAELA